MKSLVTGGAGFIGSHVARSLLEEGQAVVVLDDLSGGFQENIPEGASFVRGCITNPELVEKLFQEHRFDYVFHLGAYAAEGLSHFIKRYNHNNNLIGSVNLINASVKNGVKCFVFTSSIAVYGSQRPPMHEEMTPHPEDSYGIAKHAVEQELKVTKAFFGLPYIIFRPHNVYGENQNIGDRYRNVVGIFMNQLMQGKQLTIFGDGSQTRAFSYISDVAPFIARSIHIPSAYNQIFNIGSDEHYSVSELARLTMEAMDTPGTIRYLPARLETVHAYSDHTRARQILGYRNTVTLQEGLRKMARWAQHVGSRKSSRFTQIEILSKLPPVWLEED